MESVKDSETGEMGNHEYSFVLKANEVCAIDSGLLGGYEVENLQGRIKGALTRQESIPVQTLEQLKS